MTAPQEPLKLNPVEFANIAATITYEWTHEISTPELYSTMEFVAYVMKRTLALTARDDAAELRAAVTEHLAALTAWLKTSGAEGNPIRHVAQIDFNASILALRAALEPAETNDLMRCACCEQLFPENYLDHDTFTCPNCLSAAIDVYELEAQVHEIRAATLQGAVDVLSAAITDRQARWESADVDAKPRVGARLSALKEARGYVLALQRGQQPFRAALAATGGKP